MVDAEVNADHASDGESNQCHPHEVYAVLLPWFLQAVGILTFYVLTRKLHALPYTAIMFCVGMLLGYGASERSNCDQLSDSVRMWSDIDYEVLFTVFLPGLLFKDALDVNFHLFQASIWQLLTLAFPLVLAGTFLTALVAAYVFPYGWGMYEALTFGSILAATDPVAVSALLNEVGAPPRLKVHISGESLLNDGSAVVFFNVFGGLFLYEILGMEFLGGKSNVAQGFAIFFRMALGGTAVGLAFALGLVIMLYHLDRRMDREESILQVVCTVTTAYLCFYTSEVSCKMSGVIAVVVCGITTKALAAGMISDWQVMDSFWGLVEHLLNTIIFALGGIVFGEILGRDGVFTGKDWGYMFLLYFFINIIRFFLMFSFYPINSRIGLGTNRRETLFMSWGGLRGAVGITLALALDNVVYANTDPDDERRILTTEMFAMVGGMALLTLVINGTTAGPLLRKLGLAESTESRKHIVALAKEATRQRLLDDFIHLMTDKRFRSVDFALVQHHCPLLRDLTAAELEKGVTMNKANVHPKLYKAPHLEHVLPYIKDAGRVRASMVIARNEGFFAGDIVDKEIGLPITEEESIPEEQHFSSEEESSPADDSGRGLIKDTRLMFLELLRAAYMAQIRNGELDPREYDGFLIKSLFQSLDFAHDAVSEGAALADYEFTQIGASKFVYKAEYMFHSIFRIFFTTKGGGLKKRWQTYQSRQTFDDMHIRLNVLQALSFLDAHREAQERLQDEFDPVTSTEAASFIRASATAFRVVMNESKAQTRMAQSVLKSQNKVKLSHIVSHYLCTILNNKEARHVKLLLESGVLMQREGRHFLEEIDHQIKEIRHCTTELHPGTIELADLEEEDKSIGKVKRREEYRHMRSKQKSIL